MKKISISKIIMVILITMITMIVSNIAIADTAQSEESKSITAEYKKDVRIASISVNASTTGRLGDVLEVYVYDYGDALREAKDKNQKIVLFVNGMALKNTVPIGRELVSKGLTKLKFKLERTIETQDSEELKAVKKVWNTILSKPKLNQAFQKGITKEVAFSIGLENDRPIRYDEKYMDTKFTLVLMSNSEFIFWVVISILLFRHC